jgi:hypothetical protein
MPCRTGRSVVRVCCSRQVELWDLPMTQKQTRQGLRERRCETAAMSDVVDGEFGISHTWGQGREVVFLSNPLADPVSWSGAARGPLVDAGHRVTTFEHRCRGLDWRSAVSCPGRLRRPHARQPAGVGGAARRGSGAVAQPGSSPPTRTDCRTLLPCASRAW